MNNKQVKQMMCSLLELKMKRAGEDYKFKFICGDLACDYGCDYGNDGWYYAMPFRMPISIKANDIK